MITDLMEVKKSFHGVMNISNAPCPLIVSVPSSQSTQLKFLLKNKRPTATGFSQLPVTGGSTGGPICAGACAPVVPIDSNRLHINAIILIFFIFIYF
jgi:hypothetical protein